MKLLIVVALLLISSGGWAQKVTKQRFSQQPAPSYPLKLHVSHSFVTQDQGVAYLHLVGVINGQKVELAKSSSNGPAARGSALFDTSLLPPGDYAARLTGEDDKKDGSVLRQYDLLLANGKDESFMLVGLSE
jgi:hypothetical protein